MLLNTKSAMRAANRGNVGRKQLLKRQAHVASAVKIYTNPGAYHVKNASLDMAYPCVLPDSA